MYRDFPRVLILARNFALATRLFLRWVQVTFSHMEPLTILFMGPQGSGKGTQLELLKGFLAKKGETPIHSVETGKMFRSFMRGERLTHRLMRESLDQGKRQPDFLATFLLGSWCVENIAGMEHIIIDGYPRTLPQADTFDGVMQFYKRYPAHVVSLELDETRAMERLLKRGRHDDNTQGIRERLRWYREEVSPIIDMYRSREYYIVHAINANQAIENVHRDICAALKLI